MIVDKKYKFERRKMGKLTWHSWLTCWNI